MFKDVNTLYGIKHRYLEQHYSVMVSTIQIFWECGLVNIQSIKLWILDDLSGLQELYSITSHRLCIN